MALVVKDRVKELSTTTGTGSVTLTGVADGFQSFASALSNGDTTYYAIIDAGTGDFEIGLGTYSAGVLSRDTILESSNAGLVVNLQAGEKEVFVTYPAEKSVYYDGNGSVKLDVAEFTVDTATGGQLNVTGNILKLNRASGPFYINNDASGGSIRIQGRDIAVDGAKLDGIEAGATADQTKADIDALGINAATLGGNNASYFTGYTDTAISNLVAAAPGTLDTLNELAAALGDDPNFATTVTNSIATKLSLSGGTLTGNLSSPAFIGTTQTSATPSTDDARFDGFGVQGNRTTNPVYIHNWGNGGVRISSNSSLGTANGILVTDGGLNVTGNIVLSGTVDGRDVAADGTKLDGIEAGATADQTITAGAGLTGGGTGDVTISHADTSTQVSVNNSGAAVIQDVTLDTYGHVTGLASKTLTAADVGAITGNQTITLSGDVSGSGTTSIAVTVSDDSHNHSFSTGNFTVGNLLIGGIGAQTTGGVLDWNDASNARSGSGYTLLLGTATNGPSTSGYYHPFTFEYNSKNGSGNMTQFAIPYNGDKLFSRYRYGGVWTGWTQYFSDTYHPNADKWTTARTLTLNGDVSGSVSFDGSGNVTLTTTVADDSHNHIISNVDGLQAALDGKLDDNWLSTGTYVYDATNGTRYYYIKIALLTNNQPCSIEYYAHDDVNYPNSVHGIIDASWWNGTGGSVSIKHTQLTTDAFGVQVFIDNSNQIWMRIPGCDWGHLFRYRLKHGYATLYSGVRQEAAPANTYDVSDVGVSRRFTQGAVTSGPTHTYQYNHKFNNIASTGAITVGGNTVFHDNYHPNADKLTTARNIALTGDVTGSANFDGSANISITATVADDSHNHVISNVDGLQAALDGKLPLSGGTLTGTLSVPMLVNQPTSNYDTAGDASGFSTFYGTSAATNKPSGTDHAVATFSYSNAWQTQLAMDWRTKNAYFRTQENGTWKTWAKLWHSDNDGSGSGLDADLLDGVHGSSFLRGDTADTFTSLSGTSLALGAGVTLSEATDRGDLLLIKSSTATWAGLQIQNTSNEGLWSLMTDGSTGGIYDDMSNAWHIQFIDGGATTLYHAGSAKIATNSGGVTVTGTCTATAFVGDGADLSNVNASLLGGYASSSFVRDGGSHGTIYLSNWFRSTGTTGWYNQTYGGGIYMTDTTWVRTYNNKSFYSAGTVQAGGQMRIDGGTPFWENRQNVTTSYTITNGYNAMSAGPITINSGVTVTVGAGETWTVV